MPRHANVGFLEGNLFFSLPFYGILFSRFLCDCAINANTRPLVRAASLEYQKETNELIDSGIYNDRDDFTVVRQPFMEHMTVPLDVS